MSTEPRTDDAAEAEETAPAVDAVDTEVEGEEEAGGFIDAFGKEAVISIALFIGFVLFVIICLPTYIF